MAICILFFGWLLTSWFVNIYKFTQLDFEAPYKAEIIRGVGIPFPPLGVVVGYMDIVDTKTSN